VPLAAAVKKASGIAVLAVGMIVDPHQAEAIVAEGHADCVALARAFLDDPRWVRYAPPRSVPMPSTRARPEHWPGAALTRHRPVPQQR
jgi:2,4-dienoyl-CoA reductase-like NADH-dependent reductase (Old Yellow Enzyme family)